MENNSFYHQIMDQCPKSIMITDTNGTIVYANQMASLMSGYLADELVGQNPRLMKSGLTPAERYIDLWQTISSGYIWTGELHNRKKNGELYWEEISISPVHSNGNITHYVAVKEDISRRKLMELDLRNMASVVHNSNDFIGLCTPEMKPLFLNEAGCQMIGLEPGEPFPLTILDCFWPDDLSMIQSVAIPTLIREGNWSGEVRFKHFKTGEPIYTNWNTFVIKDDNGQPVAWATNSPNLTPLKSTEQALRLANALLEDKVVKQSEQLRFSEEKLATVFSLSPDAVIITRLCDGKYLDVNDNFTNISGYEKHEAVGKTALDLNIWVDVSDRDRLLRAIIESEKVHDIEAQFRCKNGSVITGLLYARRIEVGGEPCIMTFTRDISERKKIELALEQRKQLYKTLHAANQAIIHAENQQTLFQQLCDITVELGGFPLVWIGIKDQVSNIIQSVAASGMARSYLDGLQISAVSGPFGNGPTGLAVRFGASSICNDFMQNFATASWHAKAQYYGIKSSSAFPLIVFGRPVGVITIYAYSCNYFNHDYVQLFERLAADISFTMENIEREQQLTILKQKQDEMATELSLHDEQIRLRISSELHDHIGQSLLLGRIKLGILEKSELVDADRKIVLDVRGLLEQIIRDVRSLTLQLTPPILTNAGLEAALAWLCRQVGDDYGLKVDFEDDGNTKPLSDILRSIVYQSARELLINVAKHAGASSTQLSVFRQDNKLVLAVQDNGIGFDPALALNTPKDGCFGLLNLVRQIRHLGGMVSVVSSPDEGALISLQVPLLPADQREVGQL